MQAQIDKVMDEGATDRGKAGSQQMKELKEVRLKLVRQLKAANEPKPEEKKFYVKRLEKESPPNFIRMNKANDSLTSIEEKTPGKFVLSLAPIKTIVTGKAEVPREHKDDTQPIIIKGSNTTEFPTNVGIRMSSYEVYKARKSNQFLHRTLSRDRYRSVSRKLD